VCSWGENDDVKQQLQDAGAGIEDYGIFSINWDNYKQ
jgi:hypothetical protein